MRRTNDAYYTPEWCVHRLLDAVGYIGGDILEPCAGGGAIVRATESYHRALPPITWTTIDIDPKCDVDIHADFLTAEIHATYDYVLTNPPFSIAEEIVKKSLTLAGETIMLMRLNWLASKKRHSIFATYGCPDVYVLPDRPSFTDDGRTDGIDYAWMHWHSGTVPGVPGQIMVLDLTPSAERRGR